MLETLPDALRDWRDFYGLAGSASATLVGLTFVMVSIGANFFKERHRDSLKAFVTPTVVHFAAVLFTSLMTTVPTHSWATLGGLLGAEGLAGAFYSGRILVRLAIRRHYKIDLDDRLFYALLPTLGYLALLVAAALLFMQSPAGAALIAAGLLILLLAALRNAWDMTIWIAIPPSASGTPPAASEN
jgi:hypothetical protein